MLQTSTLESDIDTLLGSVGMNSRTARFDQSLLKLFGQAEFSTALFESCYDNPWRIPFVSQTLRQDFSGLVGKPNGAIESGSRLIGYGTRRTLLSDPSKTWVEGTTASNTLDRLLADLQKRGVITGKIPSTASIPAGTQQAASIILQALDSTLKLRRLGLAGIADLDSAYKFFGKDYDDANPDEFQKAYRCFKSVDMNYLAAGGHDLALAAQSAQAILASVPTTAVYDFEVNTAWGVIRLTGGTASTHANVPTALIIDTGGDDTYIGAPSTTSITNWASVVIDTTGNDAYLGSKELGSTTLASMTSRKRSDRLPGPGGALFGFSMLFDSAGDDVYRTLRPGLGSARFGVAVVYDREGRDTYDAYADSQGFGMFGVGMLEDDGGDDRYFGFNQVQGVGQTMGFGFLFDKTGTDTYSANDSVFDFPSAQSSEHNISMSQGAGNGRRADYLDGHSLAGGVGILFDLEGNDTYTCGVFGQGVGYWKGVGFLWDSQGFDSYTGQWYVQGAAAHFAIGVLDDEQASDRYKAPMNMAQGAGHDFSIGVLIDRAGDDNYVAPNLSLGAGNANGIGAFFDLSGNDTYESLGITLGKAAEAPKLSLRSRALCLGAFFDGGGNDKYPSACPWATNGARSPSTTDKGPTPPESQVGAFWDR